MTSIEQHPGRARTARYLKIGGVLTIAFFLISTAGLLYVRRTVEAGGVRPHGVYFWSDVALSLGLLTAAATILFQLYNVWRDDVLRLIGGRIRRAHVIGLAALAGAGILAALAGFFATQVARVSAGYMAEAGELMAVFAQALILAGAAAFTAAVVIILIRWSAHPGSS